MPCKTDFPISPCMQKSWYISPEILLYNKPAKFNTIYLVDSQCGPWDFTSYTALMLSVIPTLCQGYTNVDFTLRVKQYLVQSGLRRQLIVLRRTAWDIQSGCFGSRCSQSTFRRMKRQRNTVGLFPTDSQNEALTTRCRVFA